MDTSALQRVIPAHQWVFEGAENHADRPRFFVRDGVHWQPVTWGEFGTRIRLVAAWLLSQGIEPGERVVIFAPNSVTWGAVALGIQAAGGVMVPIYASSSAEQARYIIEHSGARFVFVDGPCDVEREGRLHLRDDLGRILGEGRDYEMTHTRQVDSRITHQDLDSPTLMLYTSGTTGNPKGVPLTHYNVGANGADWFQVMAPLLEPGMVDLLWLPMSHIFGFGEMCLGNTAGFTTYMSSPAEVIDELPRIRPSVFMSVPAYWEKVAREAMAAPAEQRVATLRKSTGGRLRLCVSGGAGLKREVKELYYSSGTLIIEGYGLTETSPTLTLNRPDSFRFDSVGQPFPSVELRLDDDGEILARGPNVFGGYFRDEDATRAAFTSEGWFRTGDLGRLTEDGFLQIVGRKKEILVTAGGKNIPPANVEMQFADDPVIQQVVVYGDGKKYLVAAVWLSEPASREDIATRIEAVNARLARCETIKNFFVCDTPLTVESGLVTASLKIKRNEIYNRFRDQLEALYQGHAKENGVLGKGAPDPALPVRGEGLAKALPGNDAQRKSSRWQNLFTLPQRLEQPVGTTPATVVHRENKWRLLRYKGEATYRRPVLLVPSLINRHYVLDLLPNKSFAEYLVARGHEVYVIDWGTPGGEDRFLTFDHFAHRYLGRAVRKVARQTGEDVHLLGYCLGGTLTTMYAAVEPDRIATLTNLAAPIRFRDSGLLSQWVRTGTFNVDALVDGFGNIPWPLMQASFYFLKPTMLASKAVHAFDRAWDDEFLNGFLALETWGNDNVSLPGEFYRTYIKELYQNDALIRGEFRLAGRRVDLANIECPLMLVSFEHDYIVPHDSATVLLDEVSSTDCAHIHLPGGHVGAVVSRKASSGLWPQLSSWWAERDKDLDRNEDEDTEPRYAVH